LTHLICARLRELIAGGVVVVHVPEVGL